MSKKNIVFIIFVLLFVLNNSCTKNCDEIIIDYMRCKEVAWNSLSESVKEIVLHDWKDAEATLEKNPDNNEDIVIVIFHTPYDALTCPISVFVDFRKEKVIYPENAPLCV